MLSSSRMNLESHSLVWSHLVALLLLYHVQTPHLQSSVGLCSWQSNFSLSLSLSLFFFGMYVCTCGIPSAFLGAVSKHTGLHITVSKVCLCWYSKCKTFQNCRERYPQIFMLLINPLGLLILKLKHQFPQAGTGPPVFLCSVGKSNVAISSALSRLTFFFMLANNVFCEVVL